MGAKGRIGLLLFLLGVKDLAEASHQNCHNTSATMLVRVSS